MANLPKENEFQDLISSMIVPLTRYTKRADLTPKEKAILQRLSDVVVEELDLLEELLDA